MDITLLGLSGSGKTCYLYVAAHLLAEGIKLGNHKISAVANKPEVDELNYNIIKMAEGYWPEGSTITKPYPFTVKIDGKTVANLNINDYRGNMLNGLEEADLTGTAKLLEAIKKSSCIIFLVDGETLLKALDPEQVKQIEYRNVNFVEQLKARKQIEYIEVLLHNCQINLERNIPILLTITKSDLLKETEMNEGKRLLIEKLPSVFSKNNDTISCITTVTLGKNLKNDNGKLRGTLYLNTNGNIHIPILFSLMLELEKTNPELENIIAEELLYSNQIDIYRGGEPAYLIV